MKIYKFFYIAIFFLTCNFISAYELKIINDPKEADRLSKKAFEGKSDLPEIYVEKNNKKGFFVLNSSNMYIKLTKPYPTYYQNAEAADLIENVEASFCSLQIKYENDSKMDVAWKSLTSCDFVQDLVYKKMKYNNNYYYVIMLDWRETFNYPQPDCTKTAIYHCVKDPVVYSRRNRTVLVYNSAYDVWVDSKYLADQRVHYIATTDTKSKIPAFSTKLEKQIKDLNIDLEDISPAAQTCYYLNPVEPCYKNYKPNN